MDYSRSKFWNGYYAKIGNLESRRTELAYRRQTLVFAVTCLSYDLTVLQANYVLDRGLRGEEAARAYRAEAASLLEEVSSARRASCERLGVNFEDGTEGLKDLALAFHRVGDDFKRLLAALPTAPDAEERIPPPAAPAKNFRVQLTVKMHGANLKKIRDQHHLTQEQLAEKGGVSVASIYRGEKSQTWKRSTLNDFVEKLKKHGIEITVAKLVLK